MLRHIVSSILAAPKVITGSGVRGPPWEPLSGKESIETMSALIGVDDMSDAAYKRRMGTSDGGYQSGHAKDGDTSPARVD